MFQNVLYHFFCFFICADAGTDPHLICPEKSFVQFFSVIIQSNRLYHSFRKGLFQDRRIFLGSQYLYHTRSAQKSCSGAHKCGSVDLFISNDQQHFTECSFVPARISLFAKSQVFFFQ